MPQPRQRIVFCDCLDCVTQPPTADIASSASPANEAAAKQEPPPKCLLLVLSGVLLPRQHESDDTAAAAGSTATVLDNLSLPHLNRAVAQGNLCLLTLRAEGEKQEGSPADACASELLQVLNMYQEHQEGKLPVTLSDRFKGMVASFSSNSSTACELAASVGMSSSSVLEGCPQHADGTHSPTAAGAGAGAAAGGGDDGLGSGLGLDPQLTAAGRGKQHRQAAGAAVAGAGDGDGASSVQQQQQQLPDPAEAARQILQELGLQHAEAGLDLLAVHVDLQTFMQQPQQGQAGVGSEQQAAAATATAEAASAAAVLAWVDKTLRYLNNSSAFKDAVLLTVLATPGASKQPAEMPMLVAAGGAKLLGGCVSTAGGGQSHGGQQRSVLRPMQSWEQLAGQQLAVDRQRAILCLRRLPGVIRRDACSRFSLGDCCSNSGGLAILADRLLPEVAYKLGRAPKYGA